MLLVVVFDDEAPMAEMRARLEPAHLAFLDAHRDEIKIAGGLRDRPGGPYVGGLWVLEVASKERAVELIEGETRTSSPTTAPTAC